MASGGQFVVSPDRAITYGIEDLVKAGMITSSTSGPRRQITLVLPAGALSKPAQDMRARPDALPAQNRRVARTQRAEIEGRRLPLPPQARKSISSSEAQSASVSEAEAKVMARLGSGSMAEGRLRAATLPKTQVQSWINAQILDALDATIIREIEAAARPSIADSPEAERKDTPTGNARLVLKCLGDGSVERK